MVGQVPGRRSRAPCLCLFADWEVCIAGLMDLQAGPPVEFTAALAKGFDMGVVVLLDYVESLATFFTHPSHDE